MTTKNMTVLALCAHPDDAEIQCGGTLLLLAKQGWKVRIATLSAGDCGSAELGPNVIAMIRRDEAIAAAAKFGGTYHYLGGNDLQVYDNNIMRSAAVALIRELQPDCILAHYPVDYMPDHEAASAIARMADFTAPMQNYAVGAAATLAPLPKGVAPLYYFAPMGGTDYFGNPVDPEFRVDISSVISEKADALACHASQREWLRRHHGIDHYIEEMKHTDSESGKLVGVAYAECFFMHKGHGFPQTPVIQNALPGHIRK
jgi:N-acetylglucosamine malate deacetylase 1